MSKNNVQVQGKACEVSLWDGNILKKSWGYNQPILHVLDIA